ncbi:ArsR/SmtB family transcription factor [Actinocatenispora comari]|jgi:ArsR family transcriptional regulator|uniref:Transcriptional regulator n=1 Tax=Actinocatenispora comari TaxID=2807577 RepID=A0A8J4ELI2_9ACTN|nr:metalloregulator ArsR/SmtB family transcription factor [Actinocatenispora comari]GIL28551.1 transcriptional regulator [Actinocatenispora comari]
MSKQRPVLTGTEATGCCSPLAEQPIAAADAADLAAAFKALGDPTRLQLVSLIASHAGGEVCVCDLTPRFAVSGPTISHHLKVLRQAGLIDCERRGTWVYYWAVPAMLTRLAGLLQVPQPAAVR